mgnify:FL=1
MASSIRYWLIATVLFFALPAVGTASDYSIPKIDVSVSITENGHVQITEELTYVFVGDFSWADYRLPKDGFTRISQIRVSENGTEYINQNNEEPGTFSVSESDDAFEIKWHYTASDTTKTFTLSYILEGALVIGPRWSEFFWNYLSSNRQKSTQYFNLTLTLPRDVSSDSIYTFTRNKTDEFNFSPTNDGYSAEGFGISRRQSARIRTLFPTGVLDRSSVEVTDPDFRLSQVLENEQQYRESERLEAERDAYYAEITPAATAILSLLSLLVFIWIYRSYGKRHPTSSLSSRETLVIPGNQSPAIIGRLMMAKQTTSNHLVATVFDLARRGWFVIEEKEKDEEESTGWFSSDDPVFEISSLKKDPDDSTLEHEQMVVEFARNRISDGHNTFNELFKGTDSDVSKWFSEWKKQVKNQFDEKNWIDKESYTGMLLNMVAQLIILAASIALLIYGTTPALVAVIFVTLVLIGSLFIIRRTPEGEETHKQWKSYIDGLKNADKRTIRMEFLDRHFIYATAFHLSQNQLETLLDSTHETAHTLIPWIVLTHGSAASPAAVASSVSTLAATGSSSFTGAAAGGAGATAGSAGGGASAGAG